MADETANKGKKELGVHSKGNILLEIGIVVMTGVLIWSLIVPQKEREQEARVLKLTRAKMKTMFQLEYAYLYVDTTYVTDYPKLAEYARKAPENVVPDSMFVPVRNAYLRFEEYRAVVEPMTLKEFRNAYIDSLITNPMTGDKFIIELATKAGRKTFNIKPSGDEEHVKWIGAVLEGEITWDEKAELAN